MGDRPRAAHARILRDVVNLPTAPFLEGHVAGYIRRFVAARPRLSIRRDPFGNLFIRYAPPRRAKGRARQLLLAAHMDHPGFVATDMIEPRRLRAEFRGWVSASYFPGAAVRFYVEGRWVRGRIREVIREKLRTAGDRRARASADSFRDQDPPESVIVEVRGPVPAGAIGMWDFADAWQRGPRLFARACDDLAGLAAVLCGLDEMVRRRVPAPCNAFFTRAEEVGFGGALAALDAGCVPANALVVAVECSKAVPGVELGGGPVLRVGDKASIFTPAATAWCQVAAQELARRDKSFHFQRKLMDGGTCESTAYCHYGLDATGVCLPLGNYHNMDESRRRPGPEYVDLRDFAGLVKWFVALARDSSRPGGANPHTILAGRLGDLLRRHRPRLLQSAAFLDSCSR